MALWHSTLVAAKIIRDSSAIALGDFRAELDVLRRVHHPNAVQFLGACTKQQPYILVSGTPPLQSSDHNSRQFSGFAVCSVLFCSSG